MGSTRTNQNPYVGQRGCLPFDTQSPHNHKDLQLLVFTAMGKTGFLERKRESQREEHREEER